MIDPQHGEDLMKKCNPTHKAYSLTVIKGQFCKLKFSGRYLIESVVLGCRGVSKRLRCGNGPREMWEIGKSTRERSCG
jgi:hypothetical protein